MNELYVWKSYIVSVFPYAKCKQQCWIMLSLVLCAKIHLTNHNEKYQRTKIVPFDMFSGVLRKDRAWWKQVMVGRM